MSRLVKLVAANGGQPARAEDARRRFFGDDSLEYDLDILLWAEGDKAAADRLARALPVLGDHREAWRFPCEVAPSRLRRADTTGLSTVLTSLRTSPVTDAQLCARVLALLGTDKRAGRTFPARRGATSLG